MYCKNCGNKNPEEANYCLEDGYSLHETSVHVIFTKESTNYCTNCGVENLQYASYCSHCGKFLLKAESQRQRNSPSISAPKQMNIPSFKSHGFKDFVSSNIKESIIGAIISIGLFALISFIIQTVISDKINEYLAELLDLGYFNLNIQLIKFTDIMLLSHLVGLKITLGPQVFQIKLGLFILLFIPFVPLFVGGFIMGKRNPMMDVMERIYGAITIGAFYAIILSIISFFSGNSISPHIKLFVDIGEISSSYSFIGALINGFMIGTLFSMFGLLYQLGSKKITAHFRNTIPYGEAIHQGISSVFRGIIVAILISFILFIGFDDLEEMPGGILGGALIIGPYMWSFLNFIPLKLAVAIFGKLNISIFSLIQGDDPFSYYFDEVKIYILLGLVIPILIFYWSGRKIKQATSGEVLKEIGVYSLTYSLLMTIIAAFTKMNILDAYFVEFSPFKTFIFSFIFSALIGFISYKLTPTKDTSIGHISGTVAK